MPVRKHTATNGCSVNVSSTTTRPDSRPGPSPSATEAKTGMAKDTKPEANDDVSAAPLVDDAAVVANLVDAIKGAIRTPWDLESKTAAIGPTGETGSRQLDPRKVAYHEAGHAVIARNFGLAVMRVSINPADDELFAGLPREGYTRLEPDAERHASVQRRLWIALAGPAAHEHLDRGNDRIEDLVCARADHEYARKLYAELRGNPDCKPEELISDERRARALVTKHWSAIEAVALALLEHPRRTLDGKELDALLLAQQRN